MKSKNLIILCIVLVIAIAIGVTWVGAQEPPPLVYYACVNNGSGMMRIVEPGETCYPHERQIFWYSEGPKGDKGDPGISWYDANIVNHQSMFTLWTADLTALDIACDEGGTALSSSIEPANSPSLVIFEDHPVGQDAWHYTAQNVVYPTGVAGLLHLKCAYPPPPPE